MTDFAPSHDEVIDPSRIDPWTVPGIVGTELARQWEHLNAIGGDLRRTQAASRGQLRALADVARRIRYLAMQSQQLSRLAGGRLRQSHERIDLKAMVEQVVADNRRQHTARALELDLQLQPVEVIVDPGLLHSLVETAIDCLAGYGTAISVWLKVSNWPEHGILEFRARERVSTGVGGPVEVPQSVAWVLLAQLARTTGVLLRRETVSGYLSVTLEFPRTVKRLEGLTAIEIDGGDPASMFESRPMAGHRLLLVSADTALQDLVRGICRDMGLVLDVSPSVRQAVQQCELDKPDGLLVDERLHDKAFDELRNDLLRYQPHHPCVEIASGANVVEIASWMGSGVSRISRDALRGQLPSLLVMELAKVL
ncbi:MULTISPECIES: hypothetical protein [Ramlibacter]|uniref:Uncharacterized protein n=1 Tax=Ramlibacter pinisoli TaxID=2682844 RepID=A0A6N8ITP1_9BURK|nr:MULTISPECIES: hypothetical protein [Ramlibacter]MBA2964430.1 hypothetical protein [Ramlibacter sp. CGMCC 1.13660]MVQ29396.1 hypothetical protein [Ramlibacter pinisoli]